MKRIITLTLISVLIIVAFTGCPTALDPDISTDVAAAAGSENLQPESAQDEELTGVKFTIPRWAPWIGAVPVSRAFAFTDSVVITILDSSAQTVTEGTYYPEAAGAGIISCELVLEPGTGYTAEVEIFNHQNSESVPVVSGASSTSFDILAGQTTQVPVYCIPVSPIEAPGENTEYSASIEAMPISAEGYPTGSGGEAWFRLSIPDSGFVSIDFDVPAGVLFYYGTFDEDGAAVINFGSEVGGPGPGSAQGQGDPGEDFYIGLVAGAYGVSGSLDVSLSWEELVPDYLDESDVPDEGLRALIEENVGGGKEFATSVNPSPADQISSMDLAMLTSITNLEYGRLISDLSGLELCTGIYSLELDSADLSGIDQTSGGSSALILESLVNLNWLTLHSCGLTDLGFLSGLSDLSGLSVSHNIGLDIYDFSILTVSNFPVLQYLYLSGWDLDADGDLDEDDAFTGEYWSDVMAIVRPFTNLRSLELSSFYMGDTAFIRLFDSGEVLDSNAGTLSSLMLQNSNISDASMEYPYIEGLSQLGYLALDGNSGINNIGLIEELTSLEFLSLSWTSVSDLAPLQIMFAGGAFQNHFTYTHCDVDVGYCGMDITPGSDNEGIISTLVSNGVRISYSDGNNTSIHISRLGEILSDDTDVVYYADLAAAENRVFASAGYLGALPYDCLGSYDITDPSAPVEDSLLVMQGYLQEFVLVGDFIYANVNVSDGSSEMTVIDVSVPALPVIRGKLSMKTAESNGVGRGIDAAGGYVYFMIEDNGLQIIDVSDPDNPVIAGEYVDADMSISSAVYVDDAADRAYIGDYEDGAYDLKIIDISSKSTPVLVSTLDTGASNVNSIAGDGDYIYISNRSAYGLKIVDISDEEFPAVEGSYQDPYVGLIYDVIVVDSIPLIHAHGLITVLDVSDPSNPAEVYSITDTAYATFGFISWNGTCLVTNGGGFEGEDGPKVFSFKH